MYYQPGHIQTDFLPLHPTPALFSHCSKHHFLQVKWSFLVLTSTKWSSKQHLFFFHPVAQPHFPKELLHLGTLRLWFWELNIKAKVLSAIISCLVGVKMHFNYWKLHKTVDLFISNSVPRFFSMSLTTINIRITVEHSVQRETISLALSSTMYCSGLLYLGVEKKNQNVYI